VRRLWELAGGTVSLGLEGGPVVEPGIFFDVQGVVFFGDDAWVGQPGAEVVIKPKGSQSMRYVHAGVADDRLPGSENKQPTDSVEKGTDDEIEDLDPGVI
jgi:hypothetical protein